MWVREREMSCVRAAVALVDGVTCNTHGRGKRYATMTKLDYRNGRDRGIGTELTVVAAGIAG